MSSCEEDHSNENRSKMKSDMDTVVLLPPPGTNSVRRDEGEGEEERRRKKRRRRFLLFLCLAASIAAAAALCLALLVPMGDLGEEDGVEDGGTREAPKPNVSLISGMFILERFAPDFGEYLRSLNMPRQVIPVILNASEVLEISQGGERWKIVIKTDYGEHSLSFRLDEPFASSGGDTSYLCSLSSPSALACSARSKESSVVSVMDFSESGMTETKRNSRTGHSSDKYFVRISQDLGRVTAEDLLGKAEDRDEYYYGDDEYYYGDYLEEYLDEVWD